MAANMNMSKTRKPTILVDLDDTLIDLLSKWVAAINKKYGTNVKAEDVDDWEITRFFPTLTRHQVFEPIFEDDFWDDIHPKEDAIQYLRLLKHEGFTIYICTNTNYKTLKDKMDNVLFKYFDFLSWNDVIVTTNKQIVNADFLIDDGTHNLVGGSYKGILMDAPHNRNFDESKHDIIRVRNWREIYAYLKSITEEEE